MAWTTPITSNSPATKVTVTTFDKIGANQVYLKERADVVDANQLVKTTDSVSFPNVTATTKVTTPTVNSTTVNNSGTINTANINTGNGAVECYAMNQPTRTTDNVTFNSVTTDNVAIKHKYFSGTLSGGLASFSHGIALSNIIGAVTSVLKDSIWYDGGSAEWDSTTLYIESGSLFTSYRTLITYKT